MFWLVLMFTLLLTDLIGEPGVMSNRCEKRSASSSSVAVLVIEARKALISLIAQKY